MFLQWTVYGSCGVTGPSVPTRVAPTALSSGTGPVLAPSMVAPTVVVPGMKLGHATLTRVQVRPCSPLPFRLWNFRYPISTKWR